MANKSLATIECRRYFVPMAKQKKGKKKEEWDCADVLQFLEEFTTQVQNAILHSEQLQGMAVGAQSSVKKSYIDKAKEHLSTEQIQKCEKMDERKCLESLMLESQKAIGRRNKLIFKSGPTSVTWSVPKNLSRSEMLEKQKAIAELRSLEKWNARQNNIWQGLNHALINYPVQLIVETFSIYDAKLIRLLRQLLDANPFLLDSESIKKDGEKMSLGLTYKELRRQGDLKASLIKIRENYLESVTRYDRVSLFNKIKYFVDEINSSRPSEEVDSTPTLTFNPTIQRRKYSFVADIRNAIVHNDSYLPESKMSHLDYFVKEHGLCRKDFILPDSPNLIYLSSDGLNQSISVLYISAIELFAYLYISLGGSGEKLLNSLLESSYKIMRNGDWRLAESCYRWIKNNDITKYAEGDNEREDGGGKSRATTISETDYLVLINLAYSHKRSYPRRKTYLSILEEYNFSTVKARYRFAYHCISEDWDEAFEVLNKFSLENLDMSKQDFDEWPLLSALRKTKRYKEFYKKEFGESAESGDLVHSLGVSVNT